MKSLLDEIISKNINSFISNNTINEHYSQLELPFDGNTLKPNYEYFIDYLEEIGRYGTLQPAQEGFDYHNKVDFASLTNDILGNSGDACVRDLMINAFSTLLWKKYHTDLDDELMVKHGLDSDFDDEDDLMDGILSYIKENVDKNAGPEEIKHIVKKY